MKILLIEPAKAPVTLGGEEFFIYEPLALEYVAAGVVQDHDVRILDLRLEDNLQQTLETYCPDVVGITAYTVHVNTVRGLFEQIKAWNPRALTVVGGHHATIMPQDLSSAAIDLIVLGEGVFTFQEIVARFERGEGFDGIPGIAFTRNGGLVKIDYSPEVDLDLFPMPERGLTAQVREHYFSEWMKPLASMRTSKGCPYRCNFCALWKITGGAYLKRKPEAVVEELAGIGEEYVFFADDESLVDAARMHELARRIGEAGIKKQYFLYGRSDTIARNPELLEAWKEIGLERVFVGLEFFQDEDLRFVGKGSTIEDNARAVRVLHDLDIEIYASFIIRPGYSAADFAALRDYCHELELSFASFAVLTPLPGTDFYQEVEAHLITRNYDYFDFLHTVLPTKLPLKQFYAEYARLYRSAMPLKGQLSLLAKFPLRELPATLGRAYRLQGLLRMAYRDYDEVGGIGVDGAFS